MTPTTIEHTSRRTYGVETRGEPNTPELIGNSRISQTRESIRLLSRWVERPGACLDAEPINR